MFQPHLQHDIKDPVYVSMRHKSEVQHYTSTLTGINHELTIAQSHLYVKGRGILLRADLHPLTANNYPLGVAAIFVKLPDKQILVGKPEPLHPTWDDPVPKWVV